MGGRATPGVKMRMLESEPVDRPPIISLVGVLILALVVVAGIGGAIYLLICDVDGLPRRVQRFVGQGGIALGILSAAVAYKMASRWVRWWMSR